MVDYLRTSDVRRFVAAAGVLAHYVGDASQPLHCSYLHHGRPPMATRHGRKYPVPHGSAKFQAFKKTARAKIHAVYEQQMFEVDAPALLADVNAALEPPGAAIPSIASGHGAAAALLDMMHAAHARLSPARVIAADDAGLPPRARAEHLWTNTAIREATVASIADSVRLLAALWESAWREGGGPELDASEIRQFSEDSLARICREEHESFVPSLSLDEMAESGRFEPPS
jgi:hypothetical protein